MTGQFQEYWKIGARFFFIVGWLTSPSLDSAALAKERELKIGELDARVLPASAKDGINLIPNLSLSPGPLPVTLPDPDDPDAKPVVTLEGSLRAPDWPLLLLPDGKNIPVVETNGHFQVRISIAQPNSAIYLAAVAPNGQVFKAKVSLTVRDWQQVKAKIQDSGLALSRFHWTFGAGLTYLDYTQDGIPSISSILISTKGSLEYRFRPDTWSIGLSGYLSSLPLASSPSGYSLSFLGINARVGYLFPETDSGWRLGLMAGYYYATTFASSVSTTSFGYANLGGLQLYPTLSRSYGSGSSAILYFKISPVSDQFTILSLSNREIASGLTYQFRPDARQRGFSLGLDWANLVVYQAGVQGSSTTLSMSAGYRW